MIAGGLLQATSLSLLVVGGRIGVEMGLMAATTFTALVAAGLLSVILFPLLALPLLRGPAPAATPAPQAAPSAGGRAR